MAMMADIPDNVLFRVLSNRIHLTNLMPWINDVNSKDANDQLNFVLADEDWRQWKVSMELFRYFVFLFLYRIQVIRPQPRQAFILQCVTFGKQSIQLLILMKN